MDEVINYVMETPGNTNPNVLRGMLQNSSGGGNALIVKVEPNTETGKLTMNKTWKEIFDADCVSIYIINDLGRGMEKVFIPVKKVRYANAVTDTDIEYVVTCIAPNDSEIYFVTDSEDGYPEVDD